MRVLIIWEVIPERTKLFIVTGLTAELALKCGGYYIGAEENESLIELSEILDTDSEPHGHSECHESFDITGCDRVVICGQIL